MNKNKNNGETDNGTDSFSIKKISEGEETNLQYDLKRIYTDGDGKMPDISRLDKKRGSLILKFLGWIVLLSLIGGGLAAGGFYLFNWSVFNGDNGKIIMRIEGPQEVSSGEEVTYKIVINNQKKVVLGEGEMEVQYPTSFTFSKSNLKSENEANSIFSIPDIAVEEQIVLEIKGYLYGEPESQHTLKTIYAYKPANFNSVFTTSALQTLQIASSPLEITFEGPTKVGVEEEMTYEIKYVNKSEEAFNDLQFNLILPGSFDLALEDSETPKDEEGGVEVTEVEEESASAPSTDSGATADEKKRIINGQWIEEILEPEQEEIMTIKGSFDEQASGEQEIGVEVKIKNEKGDFLILTKEISTVVVIKGDLDLDLFLNGSTENQTISFGETLNFTLNYENKSDFDMEGIELKVNLDSSLIDWQSLADKNEGESLADEISWTSKQISALAFLEPEEEGGLDWSVDLKAIKDIKKSELTESEIKIKVTAVIAQLGEEENEITVRGPQLTVKVNTDLSLKGSVRYFGDQAEALGSGPVPPKVGEPTSYHVFWTLNNSLHGVENIKVTTVLPDTVSWENVYDLSAGQFDYDSATRTVSWEINWLPQDINVVQANFEIKVTPVEEDLNKLLVLTQENKLSARDKITQGEILQTSPPLTSELEDDPIISGKGLVVE